ncbi:MAG: formylglycine-generating enzyme family protein [Candidatus Hydrogenedens sp.]|jgi:formylglycine-generating enzyme required for sulfatase activity|nr:formylglycine-generating enzyme family protein [Candidatus Hydrogenedens sp.]
MTVIRRFYSSALLFPLLLSSLAFAEPEAGEVRNFGATPFVWCPPGSFTPGTEDGEQITQGHPSWFSDETNSRNVDIQEGFWISQHEITRKLWEETMGNSPWTAWDPEGAPTLPATGISQEACVEFAERLSSTLQVRCALPSEEEWEYACRAGESYDNTSAEDPGDRAWYRWNSGGGMLHPVGQKKANAWGIHDMLGNAWEWTASLYTPPHQTGSVSIKSFGVIRGGSALSTSEFTRCTVRNSHNLHSGAPMLGFRVIIVE